MSAWPRPVIWGIRTAEKDLFSVAIILALRLFWMELAHLTKKPLQPARERNISRSCPSSRTQHVAHTHVSVAGARTSVDAPATKAICHADALLRLRCLDCLQYPSTSLSLPDCSRAHSTIYIHTCPSTYFTSSRSHSFVRPESSDYICLTYSRHATFVFIGAICLSKVAMASRAAFKRVCVNLCTSMAPDC